MAKTKTASATGLTEEEAKEVNGWMMKGFGAFIAFAVVAHALVYMWRPWLP